MLTGVLSTMLIPETNHKSLEVLSNESQDEFIQGARRLPLSLISTLPDTDEAAVPPEGAMGYLGDFQMAPIRLQPISSVLPPPAAALSKEGRAKERVDSSSTHLTSFSDLSMVSQHVR